MKFLPPHPCRAGNEHDERWSPPGASRQLPDHDIEISTRVRVGVVDREKERTRYSSEPTSVYLEEQPSPDHRCRPTVFGQTAGGLIDKTGLAGATVAVDHNQFQTIAVKRRGTSVDEHFERVRRLERHDAVLGLGQCRRRRALGRSIVDPRREQVR